MKTGKEAGLRVRKPVRAALKVSGQEEALAKELILKLEGMWCSACSWLIEGVLHRTPGVLEVKVLFASDLVRIKYLPHQVTPVRKSRTGFPSWDIDPPPFRIQRMLQRR